MNNKNNTKGLPEPEEGRIIKYLEFLCYYDPQGEVFLDRIDSLGMKSSGVYSSGMLKRVFIYIDKDDNTMEIANILSNILEELYPYDKDISYLLWRYE
jgi:hypothetical protein